MKSYTTWLLALLAVMGCGGPAGLQTDPNRSAGLDSTQRAVGKPATQPNAKPLPSPAIAEKHQVLTGSVVAVTDGNTVTFRSDDRTVLKVRLFGIDAPEGPQPYSSEATAALSEKALNQSVSLTCVDKDRYGRTVGMLEISDRSVNLEMVREGYAWHYRKYSDDVELANAETAARKAGLGLWSAEKPIPPWDFRRNRGAVTQAAAAIPVSVKPAAEGPLKSPSPEKDHGTRTEAIAFARILERRFPELKPQAVGSVVYVTKTGTKHHSAGCRHVRKSSIPMEYSKARTRYSACKVCGGGGGSSLPASPTVWDKAKINRGNLEWAVEGKANQQTTRAVVFVDRKGDWKLRALRVGRKTIFEDNNTPSQSDASHPVSASGSLAALASSNHHP